jgi:hypothetical protein
MKQGNVWREDWGMPLVFGEVGDDLLSGFERGCRWDEPERVVWRSALITLGWDGDRVDLPFNGCLSRSLIAVLVIRRGKQP